MYWLIVMSRTTSDVVYSMYYGVLLFLDATFILLVKLTVAEISADDLTKATKEMAVYKINYSINHIHADCSTCHLRHCSKRHVVDEQNVKIRLTALVSLFLHSCETSRVEFYSNTNELSRKFPQPDITDFTYLGKMIEIALKSR